MRVAQHLMSTEVDAHDEEAVQFTRETAENLRAAKEWNEFLRLMLVAEAGFLGKLKRAPDAQMLGSVIATLDRDFHQKSSSEPSLRLDGYLVLR